ncbi:MAG: HAMP domain-containing protein [Desulfobacter sp.]
MRIRTRLNLLFTSVTVVVGISLAGMFYAEFEISNSMTASRNAYSIVNEVSQLNRIATEISAAGIPRLQHIWVEKSASLRWAIHAYQGNDKIIAKMESEVEQLDNVFNMLVATFDSRALPDAANVDFDQARMHRVRRLTEMLQSVSGLADRIATESHAHIREVQKRRNFFLSGSLVLWCSFILIWGIALRRGIMAPLGRLMNSIKIVGTGNLDHRVRVTDKNDEINHLMVSFNSMMDRLADLTVSRKKVLDAAEQERVRIGRDLHDGVCQVLAGACMKLEVISKEAPCKEEIQPILAQVVQTQADIRRISKDLHPTILDEFGIIMTLEWLFSKYNHTVDILFQSHVNEDDIPENLHTAIFRIAQEAVVNIHKHSGAGTVHVQISRGDGTIDLCIEDNGRGFDAGRKYKGSGLINMRERTAAEQGDFIIDTSRGQGCSIIASFPENPSLITV